MVALKTPWLLSPRLEAAGEARADADDVLLVGLEPGDATLVRNRVLLQARGYLGVRTPAQPGGVELSSDPPQN